MQAFPHLYSVKATGTVGGAVDLTSPRLTMLQSASPAEFGGPGDQWSPETLLVAALGDCFVLTFRGIAAASKLDWTSIACDVTGTLDRVDRVTQFTDFAIVAELVVADSKDVERAQHLLEKAERNCLISASLKGSIRLDARVLPPAATAAAGGSAAAAGAARTAAA